MEAHFNLGLNPKIESLVKNMLRLTDAEDVYARVKDSSSLPLTAGDFCERALKELEISYVLPTQQLEELKKIGGPIVFVANHPFGAADALLLMKLMSEVRPEFKFVGNSILKVFPELENVLIPVKIMDQDKDAFSNAGQLRASLKFLRNNGLLGFFPAGEVAAFRSIFSKKLAERPWHPHVGGLIKKSKATVVPVFFEGQNSLLFQYGGLIAPKLRIALLAREMLNFKRRINFKIGAPIFFEELGKNKSASEITEVVRNRTFE